MTKGHLSGTTILLVSMNHPSIADADWKRIMDHIGGCDRCADDLDVHLRMDDPCEDALPGTQEAAGRWGTAAGDRPLRARDHP